MRIASVVLVSSLLFGLVAGQSLAGPAYRPAPLAPARAVTPPAELIAAATALLAAVQRNDRQAIAAGIAPQLTLVDGALELGLPRRTETIGPFETIEQTMTALANNIGGIYETPGDVRDLTPYATRAEREFIANSLTDGQSWGRDPLLDDAICSYAFRNYDRHAIERLGKELDTATSSFFYVDAQTDVLAKPETGAAVAARLEPNRLYGLDYDTDARGPWIAVHLPQGGTGFVSFDTVELNKPYATGICFSKAADGRWLMSAQTATNL